MSSENKENPITIEQIDIEKELLKSLSKELKKYFQDNLPLDGWWFECMREEEHLSEISADDLSYILAKYPYKKELINKIKAKLDEIASMTIQN